MENLAKALVAFRAECPQVEFDSTNPHFGSGFASLKAIHSAVDPILAKHGLAVIQLAVGDEKTAGCVTRIIHESGETMEQEFRVPIGKADAQKACAAVSYARRFGLSGALGIVTAADVDGNDAVSKPLTPKSIEKIKHAADARAKDIGDESLVAKEIVRLSYRSIGVAKWGEVTEDHAADLLSAIQEFEPGQEAA